MPGGNNHSFKPIKPRAYGSTKELVGRAVKQAGGVDEVCVILDRSKSTVYGFTDDAEPHSNLTFDMARRLTKLGNVTALAEDLAAQARGLFVPLQPVEGASTWPDIGALASSEFSQFIQLLIRAVGDRRVDANERVRLKREIDDVLRVMAQARAKLEEEGGDA